MKSLLFIISLTFSSLLFSCSKKVEGPIRIKVEEVIKELGPVTEVKKGDPKEIPFRPEFYGEGMIENSYKILSYKDLAFIIVEFESEEHAHKEAKRLKQYYYKNWLLDEVANEPSLEDLVVANLKAVNPTLTHQIIPRHHPSKEPVGKAGGGGH